MGGLLLFSWLHDNGNVENWWSVQPHQFVHHDWGKCTVAVDTKLGEAQVLMNGERHRVKIFEVSDSTERLALQAVCDAHDGRLAGEILLRILGRDDLADKVQVFDPLGRESDVDV